MDFMEISRKRKTVRRFSQTPVEQEKLEKILELDDAGLHGKGRVLLPFVHETNDRRKTGMALPAVP